MRNIINYSNQSSKVSGVKLWVAVLAVFSFIFVSFVNVSAASAVEGSSASNHSVSDYAHDVYLGDFGSPDDNGNSNDEDSENSGDFSFEEVAKHRASFALSLPSVYSDKIFADEIRSWISSKSIYLLQPGGL